MVICLERDADLHMSQLMPLPLAVSCFSKIQIGFTFLVPAHLGCPGERAVKGVYVCICSPKGATEPINVESAGIINANGWLIMAGCGELDFTHVGLSMYG